MDGRVIIAVAIMTQAITTSNSFWAAAADTFDVSTYTRNASLGTDLDLFWTIDTNLETICVAVHAKTASGWAGLGVSEMGGMDGADIVYHEAAARKRSREYSEACPISQLPK